MLRWDLIDIRDGFELRLEGKTLIRHTRAKPWLRLGRGTAQYSMFRGNFKSSDRIERMPAFSDFSIERTADGALLRFFAPGAAAASRDELLVRVYLERGARRGPEDADRGAPPGLPTEALLPESLVVEFASLPSWVNRCVLSLTAAPGEHAYGCGEQFSRFDLRGKRFPLWTSEQGVGRNKRTRVTRLADKAEGAGGDYWWTFFPQPSYVTSRRLRVHLESDAWSEFDFRRRSRIELSSRQAPKRLVFGSAPDMASLAADNARYFGLQPELPAWMHEGVILGIQGGRDACLAKLEAAQKAGVPVAAIWAQDWAGVRHTSFGKRLSWNWIVDDGLYPGLKELCAGLKERGVRFMGYVNCYFACDKPIFAELDALGLLVKDKGGASYRMDAGEFDAGIPDLTNPAARSWFKALIKRNLLDLGIMGWMADFGEYLPADCVLFDGTPAELAHNLWPVLWAKVNYEALEEAGAFEEASYFMRAGYTGSQRWCPLMWAGDQNVDWSKDDGLPSVIPAALSLAMLGHGYHHSDLGGYTTLFHLKRSKELFLRWAELSAFTMVMRSHEGNRPATNWQFDSDQGTLEGLARMGRLRAAMAPYFKELARFCSSLGEPTLRPLFMADEGDEALWRIQDQFMAGNDLVVAPILKPGATSRRLRLPAGRWIQLWTGEEAEGRRWLRGRGPLGQPPAYYRAGSSWEALFKEAARQARG